MTVTTSYELGQSGGAWIGAANREDLLDVITVLSPTDTPLFTMFRKAQVSNVQVEWLVDTLDQAGTNAVAEGSTPTFGVSTARVRLKNLCQISREQYEVSDTQRAVNPAGIRDELRYQMAKALKQWKRDVEHDIVNGMSVTGTPASTRCAMGVWAWLSGFSSKTANVAAANTALNVQEDEVNTRLQSIWVSGGLADYIVCTPTQKRAISTNFSGSANSRRTRPTTDNAVTNVVDWYESDFGNVKVLPHRWFSSAAPGMAGTPNIQRTTIMIQSDKWVLGFLRPPKNVPLSKVGSSERQMVEGEWTLIALHPSAGAWLSGHASGATVDNFPTN